MNALAKPEVGDYANDHFVSAHQKVGTFRVVNGQKQGGNVASYFCTADGTVLHAVAGPVDAAAYLRELRWAVEIHNKATTEARGDALKYKLAIRTAHYMRLKDDFGVTIPTKLLPRIAATIVPSGKALHQLHVGGGAAQQVSALLTAYPLAKLEEFYPVVWRHVLGEEVSWSPVKVVGN